jgi:hypothetical protein
MFASPVAKAKSKTAANLDGASILHRAASFGRRHGGAEPEAGPASGRDGVPGAAWDFSQIPVSSPERMGGLQPPFPAPRLPAPLQAKLVVGAVDDPLEREADRLAEQVMRMNVPGAPLTSAPPKVSRKCAACEEEEKKLQMKPAGAPEAAAGGAPSIVHDVLRSQGQPLDRLTRDFFEPRFGYDFSRVRVHVDARAGASVRSVGALAYTAGLNVVFGPGRYSPQSEGGRRLLAHELAHVVQQGTGRSDTAIQRACLSGAVCVSPPGSASGFGAAVGTREAAARARRAAMSPSRQRAHGHTGHARQLERFLNSQAPGFLGNIHGIFIDQDMDPDVAASTQDCASMVPPITGATKPCVFVHGSMNQQALTFNTDVAAATIGGRPREDWRIDTVQTLIHEIQHVLYDIAFAGAAAPGGVTSCGRADIESELSELNAIMSEFPSVFDAVPVGAAAAHPAAVRLRTWFTLSITNPGESVRGILTTIRCKCSCPDSDAFVRETFNFVTSAWTTAQKDAFNAELRRPGWGISWPL